MSKRLTSKPQKLTGLSTFFPEFLCPLLELARPPNYFAFLHLTSNINFHELRIYKMWKKLVLREEFIKLEPQECVGGIDSGKARTRKLPLRMRVYNTV